MTTGDVPKCNVCGQYVFAPHFHGYEPKEIWLNKAGEADGRIWLKPISIKPNGHWISFPRRWKRNARKLQVAQFGMQPNVKPHSRGYRKHIRRMKARNA